MRWTPWFTAVHYAYRQAGNGAFVELGYFPNNEINGHTVLLEGEDAVAFIDRIERFEANEDIVFRLGLENVIDQEIANYFDDRMM
jgi:hypothetical protein